MGTWGPGIFDDDVANDVRASFEDELSAGWDIPLATQHVLEQFAVTPDDEDDGPVVYLALAALQLEHRALQPDIQKQAIRILTSDQGIDNLEHGALQPHVREQVLHAIAKGQGFADSETWESSILAERVRVLAELYERLSKL